MITYRVGDSLPALQILIRDAGMVIDLTNLDVKVRWQRGDNTVIAERNAVVTDAQNGVAEYQWQVGDLAVTGVYRAIVQLQPKTTTLRYSLTNPPVIEIEVLANDFESQTNFDLIPSPAASYVAEVAGIDLSTANSNVLRNTIERARRLAYSFVGFGRCPNLSFNPAQQALLADLVAMLAVKEYLTDPTVEYGPFRSEQIGSYQYQLKIDQRRTAFTNPYARTGISAIDSVIQYFAEICRLSGTALEINYPDWQQPIVERIWPPLVAGRDFDVF